MMARSVPHCDIQATVPVDILVQHPPFRRIRNGAAWRCKRRVSTTK
jgi:hypothetical protein